MSLAEMVRERIKDTDKQEQILQAIFLSKHPKHKKETDQAESKGNTFIQALISLDKGVKVKAEDNLNDGKNKTGQEQL